MFAAGESCVAILRLHSHLVHLSPLHEILLEVELTIPPPCHPFPWLRTPKSWESVADFMRNPFALAWNIVKLEFADGTPAWEFLLGGTKPCDVGIREGRVGLSTLFIRMCSPCFLGSVLMCPVHSHSHHNPTSVVFLELGGGRGWCRQAELDVQGLPCYEWTLGCLWCQQRQDHLEWRWKRDESMDFILIVRFSWRGLRREGMIQNQGKQSFYFGIKWKKNTSMYCVYAMLKTD